MCDGGRAVHGGLLARLVMVKAAALASAASRAKERGAATTGERAGSRQRRTLGPIGVVGSGSFLVRRKMGCAGSAVDLGSAMQHDEQPGSSNPGLADDENEDRWVLGKMTVDGALEENDLRRSGMKMNLLMTGEEDLPRVVAVIIVGLWPRRIWNVLVVVVVMSGLDRGKDGPTVVGIAGGGRRLLLRRGSTAMMHGKRRQCSGWLRAAAAGGTAGSSGVVVAHRRAVSSSAGSHGCRPSHVDDGARKVLHGIGRGRTLPVHM
ncbi:hypothetical protein ACLOJK_014523 [Asimina triloba]